MTLLLRCTCSPNWSATEPFGEGLPGGFSLSLSPWAPRQTSHLPLYPSTPGRPSTPLGRADAAQYYGYGFESVQGRIFSASSATAEVAELTALIFTTFIPWSCKRGRISIVFHICDKMCAKCSIFYITLKQRHSLRR